MDELVIKTLRDAFAKDRLPHSILFYGENNQIFDRISRSLFQDVLNTPLNPASHPDFFSLYPDGKMQIIKIEKIRSLIKKVQHSANQGGKKIVVIHDADRMNVESANAFLKTLEEPPADTVIFLFTARLYSLLETIRSRCLKFKISTDSKPIQFEEWKSWFSKYEEWLLKIHSKPRARIDISRLVLSAYALIARFDPLVKGVAQEEWEQLKKQLPDNLEEESLVAMETAIAKGARSKVLKEIERRNQLVFQGLLQQEPHLDPPIQKLVRITENLEKLNGLMGVNLQPASALENYFLQALRVWSS